MIKYIIFVIGIIVASCFYTIANFNEKSDHKGFIFILATSLMYAFFEYVIKIPLWYYVRDVISPLVIQITWTTVITIMVLLYQYFILKKSVHTISILLGIISMILVILIILIEHKK